MIDPEVLSQLRRFAARLDGDRPGRLAGLYAVGSVALGDFRPTLSNIDAVAVTAGAWSAEDLAAARRALRALRRPGQPPRLALLSWEQLAGDPAGVDAPCLRGRRMLAPPEIVNPMTWAVLRTAAVCVTGPEYPAVGVGDLRAWASERLSGYWGGWARRARTRPGALLLRRSTTERVLEAARLSQILSSGRVVSKLEAGELAAVSASSRFGRILKDATGFRQGARMSMYWGPFERRNHAVAYLLAQADEAAATAASPGTP